jgi:hypothetical protein
LSKSQSPSPATAPPPVPPPLPPTIPLSCGGGGSPRRKVASWIICSSFCLVSWRWRRVIDVGLSTCIGIDLNSPCSVHFCQNNFHLVG